MRGKQVVRPPEFCHRTYHQRGFDEDIHEKSTNYYWTKLLRIIAYYCLSIKVACDRNIKGVLSSLDNNKQ